MRVSTGRWVSGDDFFDREPELRLLETLAREHNHVLLTGQRRMGKTSLTRELGRRLEAGGWAFLFADVEGADDAEDVIARIAGASHGVRSLRSRLAGRMGRWAEENINEVSVSHFRIGLRAGLSAGSWRRHGQQLLEECARYEQPVLLVVDELPIFLKRMLRHAEGRGRVDAFLSWLRGALQEVEGGSLSLIVSGSIGLEPLVRRLGIPDRINHFYPVHLGPWNRETSVRCFNRLAESQGLSVAAGVAEAVYDQLGIGIPHHVQSFFARLRDFALMGGRERLTARDVPEVYQSALLGPRGQSDLVHYETRLKDALDEEGYSIAMEILAEASLRGAFTREARHRLERRYAPLMDDVRERVGDALDVLAHDGYLEPGPEGHRFGSRLLKDWWASRFRDSRITLGSRPQDDDARTRGGADDD